MRRNLPLAAALILVLILAACAASGAGADPSGSAPPGGSGGNGDGSGGDGSAIEHPTGGGEAILVVDARGGFVPVDFMVAQVPSFALFGDGRVVMMGMQTLEYPGPALPALIERTLTEEGIQAVLAAMLETGQFDSSRELRGAMDIAADVADTIFTVNAGGRQVTVRISGLGTVLPGVELPPGFPAGELAAHEALSAFNDQLLTLDSWLSGGSWATDGWVPYEADTFRLYVRDVTGEPVEQGPPEHVLEWPIEDEDPAAFGEEQPFFGDGTRCGVVEGDAGVSWFESLNEATQMTRWTDDGQRRFRVIPRPLLPHEERTCPELGAAS